MKSELELLLERVEELKRKQSKCQHEWNEEVPDVFEKKVEIAEPTRANPYNSRTITKNIPCLSRTCKICGKKEYALEQEVVVVKTETRPKFK